MQFTDSVTIQLCVPHGLPFKMKIQETNFKKAQNERILIYLDLYPRFHHISDQQSCF